MTTIVTQAKKMVVIVQTDIYQKKLKLMKTKQDFIKFINALDIVFQKQAEELNRHEEWFNGVIATTVAFREAIKNSDLEEGE